MYGHSTAWYDDVVQWHIRNNSLNDLNRFWLINSVSEEHVFWKMVITYAKGVTYLWIWIISWCWWNLLTSANHIAQIASCDRSRIHAPDLGRTGVCPGKNSFHKKCKKEDDIAVCVITFFMYMYMMCTWNQPCCNQDRFGTILNIYRDSILFIRHLFCFALELWWAFHVANEPATTSTLVSIPITDRQRGRRDHRHLRTWKSMTNVIVLWTVGNCYDRCCWLHNSVDKAKDISVQVRWEPRFLGITFASYTAEYSVSPFIV